MNTHSTYLRFGTAVALISLAAIFTGCAKSWKSYEKDYRALLMKQGATAGQSSTSREPGFPLENDDLGISDNCTRCHRGISNPAMNRAEQPFTQHPGRYLDLHPPDSYGCTICHSGVGAALDKKVAHEGLLKTELTQLSCTKCHLSTLAAGEELSGAPELSNGTRLLKDLACTGCHRIDGFLPQGPTAPVLTGIGSKVSRRWLLRWLEDPHAVQPNASMPTYQLSDEHRNALTSYLMTFVDSSVIQSREPPRGNAEQGGNLLREARCISCHPFNGTGGHLAPDLGRVGNKVSRKWLALMLQDPKRFQPNTAMPRFNVAPNECNNLVDYFFEECTDYEMKTEDEKAAAEDHGATDMRAVELGRRIFKELRCGNCHLYEGEQEWLQLGPILTTIGDKKTEDINFGDSKIDRTLPEYIFAKIKQPQLFATAENPQKMPVYHLTDEQVKDLTVALLSFNSEKVKSKEYMEKREPSYLYEPTGEFGALLEKYKCYSCHRINGRGYNLAYDLSIEGSRVQRRWLYDYLMVSYSIRPILVERMPVFRFSRQEAGVLTDGIMAEFVRRDMPNMINERFTPQNTNLGERLFSERGCLACHIVGEKGGYVGPSFTIGAKVGDKLQPAWIYLWLKNPQAVVPGVIEPHYNFSDDEAKALTEYIVSINSNRTVRRAGSSNIGNRK